MSGIDAGTVYAGVRVKLSDLDADVAAVKAKLDTLADNVAKSAEKNESEFSKMFASMFSAEAAFRVVEKGFEGVTDFIKESNEASIEAQETFSKYNAVFEGMGQSAEDAAKGFASSFDLAGVSAKQMLSNTGNLLQGFGATREESLKMSVALNTIASDVASFSNNAGGASAASEALTKALLGETESAKSLGLVIRQDDINTRLAKEGKDKLTGSELNLAKAQATLAIITEQAKNATGDYARTHDSAANTLKRSKESTDELKVALGTRLNPATTLAASLWERVAKALADTINKQNELTAARDAEKGGNETIAQRILLLQNERDQLEKMNRANYVYQEDGTKIASEDAKATEAKIANMDKSIKALTEYNKMLTDQRDAGRAGYNEAVAQRQKQVALEEAAAEKLAKQIADRKAAESEYNDAVAQVNFKVKSGLMTQEEGTNKNKAAMETYIEKLYELGYASENEIGTKGQAALKGTIDKYNELTDAQKTQLDNYQAWTKYLEDLSNVDAEFRDNKLAGLEEEIGATDITVAQHDELIAKVKKLKDETEKAHQVQINWYNDGQIGIKAMLSGFTDVGKAIQAGTLGWNVFAKAGLNALASVLQAIGAELAALSAKEVMVAGFFNPAGWIANAWGLTASAAAYTSAGIIQGYAGSFATGGIVEPTSPGVAVRVAENGSGEVMFNTGDTGKAFTEQMAGEIASKIGGNANIVIMLDGYVLAKSTANVLNSGQVTLTARALRR